MIKKMDVKIPNNSQKSMLGPFPKKAARKAAVSVPNKPA